MINFVKKFRLRQTEQFRNQSGQTLIETLVAAFVLVTGISASVGLAVFALNATSTSSKQIVAIGLAREGIEAVKNMRDTNWLRTPFSTDCFNFYTQSSSFPNGGSCYQSWLKGGKYDSYNILDESGGNTYRLGIDKNQPNDLYWLFTKADKDYGLNFFDNEQGFGLYLTGTPPFLDGVSVSSSNTGIGRRITIEQQNPVPFDTYDYYNRVKVTVDVWWSGNRCPISDEVPEAAACRVTLETYLTNWKNYEIQTP